MSNNYAVFYCGNGGEWWTMLGKYKASDYSSILVTLGFSPKKIKMKPCRGTGEKERLESIRFTYKKFDYKIVNWGNKEPNYV